MKIFNYLKKHWKTSLAGVLVGVFTVMLFMKKIEVTEYLELVGGIGTIILLVARDWDKANEDTN